MKIKLSETQQRQYEAARAQMAAARANRKAAKAVCKHCGAAGAGPVCKVCAQG
jgi:hypothetical protein